MYIIIILFNFQPRQIGHTWKYEIQWHPEQHRSKSHTAKNIVVVTSKQRNRDENNLIEIKTWKNQDINDHSPLTVFAQVTRGGYPVLEANVFVEMRLQMSNSSQVRVFNRVRLQDNGFGGK